MSIYLAHPIDKCPASHRPVLDEMLHWCTTALTNYGLSVFNPHGAWSFGLETDPSIQALNNEAVRNSQGVLAIWPESVPSVGVGVELGMASVLGIPCAVVRADEPVALSGLPGVRIFESMQDACLWLAAAARQGGRVVRGPVEGWNLVDGTPPSPVNEPPLGPAAPPPVVGEDDQPRISWTGDGDAPFRAYDDDAGFDLVCSTTTTIDVGECVNVPADVAIEWPEGWWGLLLGRSSTFKNRALIVNPGVIDHGYRGSLFATCRNVGTEPRTVAAGERIAQIIPLPTMGTGVELQRVDELSATERGAGGFGSTGS